MTPHAIAPEIQSTDTPLHLRPLYVALCSRFNSSESSPPLAENINASIDSSPFEKRSLRISLSMHLLQSSPRSTTHFSSGPPFVNSTVYSVQSRSLRTSRRATGPPPCGKVLFPNRADPLVPPFPPPSWRSSLASASPAYGFVFVFWHFARRSFSSGRRGSLGGASWMASLSEAMASWNWPERK
jgi:hypothetical protein